MEHEATRRRIVVGVDGTPSSCAAVKWGWHLARATGATLEAVTAWQPDPTTWLGEGWVGGEIRDCEKDAREHLESCLKKTLGPDAEHVKKTVTAGAAAKVLVDASEGAQMLVVGSRGRGGVKSLLLGSVSVPCAEHATCPVLVVHGDHNPPALHLPQTELQREPTLAG